MKIGPYTLRNKLILAPMAGITDLPFRLICRKEGAALAFSEMISSKPELRKHHRTQLKATHDGEPEPRAIQLLGTEPEQLAETARENVTRGAQIIDINMGCPAKKVCNVAAGSALLKDEKRVANILEAVVASVDVPVTLKIRTGWDKNNINGVSIAKIAEQSGIQALTVHGRTRACGFTGKAEYSTIREIKQSVSIPIIANGDICSPERAKEVLEFSGADAVMIGRAAQGNPWIFSEIDYFLQQGIHLPAPNREIFCALILEHISMMHQFYGEKMGVRIARKHIGWYFKKTGETCLVEALRHIHTEDKCDGQMDRVSRALEIYKNNRWAA